MTPHTVDFYVLPTAQGTISAFIGVGATQDMATNDVHRSTIFGGPGNAVMQFDNIPPTVVLVTTTLLLTNTLRPYRATFSEPVMWFNEACITVIGELHLHGVASILAPIPPHQLALVACPIHRVVTVLLSNTAMSQAAGPPMSLKSARWCMTLTSRRSS